MKRRRFLTMLTASTLAADTTTRVLRASPAADENGREFYELRRYHFQAGPQLNQAHDFFRDGLVPALNRAGIKPVGVFTVTIGPETPSVYVLMPSSSLDKLVTAGSRLERDADYLKAGTAFLNAPAKEPAYIRVESSLLQAFEGTPTLTVPTGQNRARMFELRTYESPSDQDHKRKVEMFSGETAIFKRTGFSGVFFSDRLIGPRMPSLTYMLGFNDLADRDKKWEAFRADADWKKLSTDPRYAFETIVSNITNVILTATPYSQI
jgi:hypothetical protein